MAHTERELSTKRNMIGLHDRGPFNVGLTAQQSIKERESTLGRRVGNTLSIPSFFFLFPLSFIVI